MLAADLLADAGGTAADGRKRTHTETQSGKRLSSRSRLVHVATCVRLGAEPSGRVPRDAAVSRETERLSAARVRERTEVPRSCI